MSSQRPVKLSDEEIETCATHGVHVLHSPESNLKLASGVARVPETMAAGVHWSLGADGAPCNNNLDGFMEVRLAALLHKQRLGPTAMSAPEALRLAKRAVNAAEGPLAEGLIEEDYLFQTLLRTPDAPKAMERFLELGGQTREGELRVAELSAELAKKGWR